MRCDLARRGERIRRHRPGLLRPVHEEGRAHELRRDALREAERVEIVAHARSAAQRRRCQPTVRRESDEHGLGAAQIVRRLLRRRHGPSDSEFGDRCACLRIASATEQTLHVVAHLRREPRVERRIERDLRPHRWRHRQDHVVAVHARAVGERADAGRPAALIVATGAPSRTCDSRSVRCRRSASCALPPSQRKTSVSVQWSRGCRL